MPPKKVKSAEAMETKAAAKAAAAQLRAEKGPGQSGGEGCGKSKSYCKSKGVGFLASSSRRHKQYYGFKRTALDASLILAD